MKRTVGKAMLACLVIGFNLAVAILIVYTDGWETFFVIYGFVIALVGYVGLALYLIGANG